MIRMKIMVQLEGILTEDGQLLVQIPKTLTPGRVKITIDPIDSDPTPSPSREEMRQRMAAAGLLADTSFIPDNLVRPDIPPFVPPPGSKTTEQLIDEDRGER
jgi:hypothetical protein